MFKSIEKLFDTISKLIDFIKSICQTAEKRISFRRGVLYKRYSLMYSPINSLFLNRHLTSGQAIRAPFISQRIKRSVKFLIKLKVKEGIFALFDKCKSKPYAEIEFGGSFPLKEIQNILKGNELYADKELLNLVRLAERSRYEASFYEIKLESNELTYEEYLLFTHIMKTHLKLSKKYSK